MRGRRRVKLAAISSASRSIWRRPSPTLIMQNGIRIATCTKMIDPCPGENQIAARIAQPIDGNELRNGCTPPRITQSSAGTMRCNSARPLPITSASSTDSKTRQVEAAV